MKTRHACWSLEQSQTLPRHQFVKLAALTSGFIAAPMSIPSLLLGWDEAVQSGEGMARIELAHGCSLKSVPPRPALEVTFLAEAEQAPSSEGWRAVPVMPANNDRARSGPASPGLDYCAGVLFIQGDNH